MRRGGLGTAMVLLVAASSLAGSRRSTAAEADNTWQTAIEAYATSRDPRVLLPVLELSTDDLREQFRHALDAWAAQGRRAADGPDGHEARASARRRIEAAATAPFELLLPMSVHARPTPLWDTLEDAAVAAARDLPGVNRAYLRSLGEDRRRAEDRRLSRATAWWRAAHLQYLLNTLRLNDFRQAAQELRNDVDPAISTQVALLRGMVEETSARLAEESTAGRAGPVRPPNMRQLAIAQFLDRALTWYRRALAASPSNAEARLRLGRVLLERVQSREAVQTLTPLISAPCLNSWCGLALLFVGEAHEAMAAPARAADAYARASSAVAVRQSALVALMHLAMRRGDVTAAHALTGQFISTAPLARLEAPDAWGAYISGRRYDAEAVLAPLRQASLP
jgi:tetratricopeptide (TPR) repeat protein